MRSKALKISICAGAVILASVIAVPLAMPSYDCGHTLKVTGRGSHLMNLAELNAMSQWVKEAKQVKPAYDSWHKAAGRKLICRPIDDSERYTRCTAYGMPCAGDVPLKATVHRFAHYFQWHSAFRKKK